MSKFNENIFLTEEENQKIYKAMELISYDLEKAGIEPHHAFLGYLASAAALIGAEMVDAPNFLPITTKEYAHEMLDFYLEFKNEPTR